METVASLFRTQPVIVAALQSHDCCLSAFHDLVKLGRECNGGGTLTSRNRHPVRRAVEYVIGAVGSGAAHRIGDGDRLSNCR